MTSSGLSVLQRVVVCCSVLQYVAVCCSGRQFLYCDAVSCIVLQSVTLDYVAGVTRWIMLQCVAVCCSLLQCIALCCSVLRWIMLQARWIVLHCDTVGYVATESLHCNIVHCSVSVLHLISPLRC